MLLFTFVIIGVTGVILYFTPPGRIARWTGWNFLWMSKDQLEGVHTVCSFLFLLASVVHIVLNWKSMLQYFKSGLSLISGYRKRYTREFLLALLLSLVVFLGSYLPFTPFKDIIDAGSRLKKSWGKSQMEAPVPGAEALTLKEFAFRVLKADAGTVIKKLTSCGIHVRRPDQTLKDVAALNDCSPADLYRMMLPAREKGVEISAPH